VELEETIEARFERRRICRCELRNELGEQAATRATFDQCRQGLRAVEGGDQKSGVSSRGEKS
jgi:hypothetical protein